ncbi:MAG TPA: PEP-CTERM sorting domain-containing protein [Tepidisphaeraceae bacterium]|nr:PEP-CTERM sorting domain-containing protein [Tepidisphaeraceae bacterium]
MVGRFNARKMRAVVGHVVALSLPAISLAGAAFSSGSATWSWDADTNSALGGKTTFAIAPPSSSLLPGSPTFQLNRTGSSAGGSATGKGSIGHVANSTTTSWTFAGGSGAAQADPTNVFTGDTITKVRFGGLFDVTGSGFGPTAVGYFSLTVAGTAGVGGSTQVAFDMQWRKNGPNGALLRSAISNGTTFFGGGSPTPFSATYTYASPFAPSSVSASDDIWVGGSLTFIADNSGTPSDVVPIHFEASAAPPTATSFLTTGTGDWFNPGVWQAPNNPAAGIFSFQEPNAAVPIVPNAIGERARFVNVGSTGRTLQLSQDVTLGSLLIDDDNAVNIENLPGQAFTTTFDTLAHNATIHIGAGSGSGEHRLDSNVVLARDLELRVESPDPVTGGGSQFTFARAITNAGGAGGTPRNVTISGGGTVNYLVANDYRGVTDVIDGGNLRVASAGGLGTASANVRDGSISLDTSTPFSPVTVGQIFVREGGIVRLAMPFQQAGTISLNGRLAGVSGSPAVLGALTLSQSGIGNLDAGNGGFIGHTVFDLSPAGNPAGLTNNALHTFGVSANFSGGQIEPSIAIGSGSNSPWMGLGGDRGTFVFGTPGTQTGVVRIAGRAEISSLGGEFIVNSRLTSFEGGDLHITGGGIVALNSVDSDYQGRITVSPGANLRVDGAIPNIASITVQPGATFGGNGSVAPNLPRPTTAGPDGVAFGTVRVLSGGMLDPGLNTFNNALGVITLPNVEMEEGAILEFEFAGPGGPLDTFNDRLFVTGDLILDGELVINQLQNFDNASEYTLIDYARTIVNNGLVVSPTSQEIFGLPAVEMAQIVIIPNDGMPGGRVVLQIVPEPASAGLLALGALLTTRRRRGV